MTRDSILRAVRTFVIATLGLFIPGLLGWLRELTEWANSEGQRPFPDGEGLAYLGVSAIVAGVVAVINLIWNMVEDGIGRGMLRTPPARPPHGQGGHWSLERILVVAVLVALLLVLLGYLL